MSLHPTIAVLAAAIGLGCGSRALDPNQMKTGNGGGTISTGTGGATGDGGLGADAHIDALPPRGDSLAIEPGGGSICGNGALEPGEECDDGNVVSRDGCSRSCQIED